MKLHNYQIISTIFLVLFMTIPNFASYDFYSPQSYLTQAITPTPTKSPNDYIMNFSNLFTIKAPWPAGITFHAGKDGSFYNEYAHLNTKSGRDYYAIDFNGDTSVNEPKIDNGALILAVADGRVKSSKYSAPPSSGGCNYGWNVVIGHPGGYETRYAHLRESPFVKEGDWVAQGTPIGYDGGSGCDGGEHLHFAMYYCDPSLSSSDCNLPQNRYSVRPTPLDGVSNLDDGDRITSTNFGVGYEQLPADDIYDVDKFKKLHHDSFLTTYQLFGGEAAIFGGTETPVRKFSGSNYLYQEFGPYLFDQNSFWFDQRSALFENEKIAYLLFGPIWEKYKEMGGPASAIGLPVTHSYLWGSTSSSPSPNGLRNDFEHGSIIWQKDAGIKILDSSNAVWEVSFFRLPNFTDPALTRRDERINFSWTPPAMSGANRNFVELGSSFIAKASIDVGLISYYQIAAEFQGSVIIKSDGNEIISVSSPDQLTKTEKRSIKSGKTDIEVRFSQTPLNTAKIKITAQGLGIIPKVYAAEDEVFLGAEALTESPAVQYAGFEPPPYPDVSIPPTITITPTSTTTSSTVLIFDTSSSMAQLDVSQMQKLVAAKKAGENILEIINNENQSQGMAEHKVGVVDFNTTAKIDTVLTLDYSAWLNAVHSLSPYGNTGMPDGLKMAIELFANEQAVSKKIIILLSDGLPNVGLGRTSPGVDIVQQQVLDLASEAGLQNICIYPIGFGIPSGVVSGNVQASMNEDFLKKIVAKTGCGQYFSAKDSVELANVYSELRHSSMGNILLKKNGMISQGETIDLGKVDVPKDQAMILITLNWPGSRLEPVVVDPTGKLVDQNYAGASLNVGNTLESIIINNPNAGSWNYSIKGIDVPEGTTSYFSMVSSRPNPNPPSIVTTTGGSFPFVLLIILIGGGGVGVYVLNNSIHRTKRRQPLQKAMLIGVSGKVVPRQIKLSPNFRIGRSPTCDLQLLDLSVSRQHAIIRYAHGAWFIQDQASKVGTYVNGKKINAIALKAGDKIQIGPDEFEFHL